MAVKTVLILALNVLSIYAQGTTEEAFRDADIVPEVIPEAPDLTAWVQFLSGASAQLGNELTTVQTLEAPDVSWPADHHKLYTLFMIDPDVPSRDASVLGPLLHWQVINIPGDCVPSGDTIAKYLPPTPPPGSGPHRYIQLAYKQTRRIDEISIQSAERVKFDISSYVQKNDLIARPVAGNFFIVRG